MCDKIIISIVTWNRCETLKKTLRGIYEHTLGKYQILITDNGSTDSTVDFLKEESKKYPLDVLYLKENVGIARARNAHWYKCIGYDVVRMDDDIVIETDDWYSIYRDTAYNYNAFVGRMCDSYLSVVGKHKDDDLIFADDLEEYVADMEKEKGSDWVVKNYERHGSEGYSVNGQLMFIPKNAIYKIGYWDERYGMSGFEDIDYAIKGKILGYGQIFINSVKTKHLHKLNNLCGADDHRWPLLWQRVAKFYDDIIIKKSSVSDIIKFSYPTNKLVGTV